MLIKNSIFTIRIFVGAIIALSLFGSTASAATLSLNSSRAQVTVGETFRIQVTVDAKGVPINNAEGIMHFPQNAVSIVSVDTTGSVFGLWPESPAFVNTTGTASFNGGVVNPGYSGTGGKVVSFVVKALKTGSVPLYLSDASVRANDGLGTDVLTSAGGVTLSVIEPPLVEETKKVETVEKKTISSDTDISLTGPLLSSATHPDQTAWYNNHSISVAWQLPDGIKSTQITFGGQPGTVPSGAMITTTHKEYPNVRDGVSYFHARYRTTAGWSPVEYYAFHIDTVAPESLLVTPVTQPDGSLLLGLKGADETSGVEYFTVSIAGSKPVKVMARDGAAEYSVPAIPYIGNYKVDVVAYDRAGNSKSTTLKLEVKTLSAPKIDTFPTEVVMGNPLEISGSAMFANRSVIVYVRLPDNKVEQYLVETNESGRFTLQTEDTQLLGYYEVWAQFTNERGEKSYESAHVKTLSVASSWQRLLHFISQNALTIGLAVFALIGIICVFIHIHVQFVSYRERRKTPPHITS